MKEIGITGGIGSGKTIVTKMLLNMGFPVFNSDDYAKKVLNENHIINKIENIFGSEYISNGRVDRRKLGGLVFKNEQGLNKLNKIIHPEVAKGYESWKVKNNLPIIFKEAAILFESGAYRQMDKLILVKAPLDIRINRVMIRDGVTKGEVEARMQNQWKDEEKERMVDFVIINDDNHSLIAQINTILKSLL